MEQTGITAVAKILSGDIVPSGHLADTYCYDNLTSPAVQNFGSYDYTNADSISLDATKDEATNYIVYAEGIYVGYRYYETRYEDTVMGVGNTAGYNYHADVAYPFGYGLSYTTFAYSNFNVTFEEAADQFLVSVDVTNTGDTYSGKDAVEIYLQSPYTEYDKANNIEKASVELCGFAKTKELAPGETQTVTIAVDRSELASYDAYGNKTYILEDGTYYLTVGTDAHNAVNNILAAKGYHADNNLTFDNKTYAVSSTGKEITNQIENADLNLYDGGAQSITYLSRSNWEGTFPQAITNLTITETMKADLADRRTEVGSSEGTLPTMNSDTALKAIELRGLAFDDPKWDELLDQMSYEEMADFVGNGFHLTKAIDSVSLPDTRDENGPSGLTARLMKGNVSSTSFPSEDIMAATWNVELIAEVGECIGEDCLYNGYSGLYGPGANTHRTPYGGRNFEYYSEDSYLAAKMSMNEVAAIQENGIYVMLKHCNLNEGETDRGGICTWANEQSIREIYLRAFQDTLEKVEHSGVMTSFSRMGCIWNGAHEGMITEIIRGEWGSTGIVISDNTEFYTYMDGIEGVLAGTTLYDGMTGKQYRQLLKEGEGDVVLAEKLREACHYNMYTIVNSSAMNGITVYDDVELTTPGWKTGINVATGVSLAAFAGTTAMAVLKGKKYKKANPKPQKNK